MGEPLKVGVVGIGTISKAYFEHMAKLSNVKVVAAADLDVARAKSAADQYSVRALTPDELYADDDVDAVLNLTIPAAHASVALAALNAGKHVYGEKPLAATRQEARPLLEVAKQAGLRIGCAPDTVLGTGTQTARVLLDRGDIGVPTAATAFFVSPGPEPWHPDPEFYYKPGGGPLLDMGPYYLSSLVNLLGPVARVTGRVGRARQERTVGSGPKQGTTFTVEVDTHITGVLEHESGVLTTVVTSFDVWGAKLPRIEVYGSEGSLSVPDPNTFAGEVAVLSAGSKEWTVAPVSGGYADSGRGFGLGDMARAIQNGTSHRANGDLAFHVLDVMESLLESGAKGGAPVEVESTVERPEAVPEGATPDVA
ncbi:Gfo/Idh/MocA family protein [Actinopolymorpha pittospori]|uniref:Dehydrogenase n=1 Tax=Actinopolymorpha pittospori TaxID=648752 RepID=A0A927NCK1_9ACTN|nr:Gfo/Idh/MocA family oxidoreductase [Actinopolymorpha pittospori]MBE1612355.1 putative dehydrogenase [Actinopolymorpha pittospori]